MLPMPAQTRCSRSSSPSVGACERRARPITASRSNGSTRISGPRWASGARASRTSSITGAAKQTATTSSKLSTAVARHSGWRQRSPGRYRCQEPVIRMCECSVIPPSKCISRYLPLGSTTSTRRPFSRAMAAGRASVTTLPSMPPRSAAAVRQIVSPSGKDGPALRPEHDTFWRGPKPGLAQHPFERRRLDGCAIDALDFQLVDAGRHRGESARVGWLDVAGRQQRASAALEVEPQLAAVDDHVGAGGARHARLVLRPGDGRPVGAGRVGGGQRHHLRVLVTGGPEPVDGARERELQATEAIDEVATPDLAGFLHRPQHWIERRKSTGDALTERGLAGQYAVPLQE